MSEMRRAAFDLFAKDLLARGIPEERIRAILQKLIDKGYCEGSDEKGYILTEKGVTEIEKIIYGKLGVV